MEEINLKTELQEERENLIYAVKQIDEILTVLKE